MSYDNYSNRCTYYNAYSTNSVGTSYERQTTLLSPFWPELPNPHKYALPNLFINGV